LAYLNFKLFFAPLSTALTAGLRSGSQSNEIMLSSEKAYEKIMHWCAYQERSHRETQRKLLSYGLSTALVDELLARLISENFINEERFAATLASGKFRMKKWGRNKIRIELKKHGVSDYSIKKGLAAIDPHEYEKILQELIDKKLKSLKNESAFKTLYKVRNYAISKGFESDLVVQLTSKLENEYES
jgi:regulatory protein